MVTADDETRGEVTEDSNHKEETVEEGEGDQGGQVHLGAAWGRHSQTQPVTWSLDMDTTLD